MRIDGLTLTNGSEITNADVEHGTTLPVTNLGIGRLFFLTQTDGAFTKGLYHYDGTTWLGGDISSVVAGNGLTGGGTSGDVTLTVDASKVAVYNLSGLIDSERLPLVPVANGGTGLTTPGVAGNVLQSNGSAWVSSTPSVSTGANTFTARQTIPAVQTTIINKGTVGTGTVTFDGSLADYQRLQVSGALTIAFSNLPAAGTTEGIVIELVNGGSAAVTMPTCTWIKSDGSTSATFSDMGVTLQASGTNWLVFWLNTAGTLCGKVAR